MFTAFEYKDRVLEVVYLLVGPNVSLESKRHIVEEAVRMYVDGDDRRKIKGDDFEGKLETKGEYQCLETFGGLKYYCDVDAPCGVSSSTFLLCDRSHLSREFSEN